MAKNIFMDVVVGVSEAFIHVAGGILGAVVDPAAATKPSIGDAVVRQDSGSGKSKRDHDSSSDNDGRGGADNY
jgi:hypothetical protein